MSRILIVIVLILATCFGISFISSMFGVDPPRENYTVTPIFQAMDDD